MIEEKKEAVRTKVKAVKSEPAQKEVVIYIGPSIKNVVSTGTVYNNGLPKFLKEEIERQPVLKSLIIPVGKLADIQNDLRIPESAVSLICKKVRTE